MTVYRAMNHGEIDRDTQEILSQALQQEGHPSVQEMIERSAGLGPARRR
jgi:hypothetical protein